jgi:hypothetical protein
MDTVIRESEEHRPYMGGNRSDVLKAGPKQGIVKELSWNDQSQRLSLGIQVGREGNINEGFNLNSGGLNYFLGACTSAGIKTVGKTIKVLCKEIKGKTVYFDYAPPSEDNKYHKVSFVAQTDYRRLVARAAERAAEGSGDGGGSASWADESPAKPPAEPEETDPTADEETPAPGGDDSDFDFLA